MKNNLFSSIITKRSFEILLSSFVIPYFIFIKQPLDFYIRNSNELIFYSEYYLIYFLLFFFTFLALFILNIIFEKGSRFSLKASVFFIIYIFFMELIFNAYWPFRIIEILIIFLFEVLLFSFLIYFIYKANYIKLVKIILVTILSIVSLDLFNTINNLDKFKSRDINISKSPSYNSEKFPNSIINNEFIYHLVLDGFSSHLFDLDYINSTFPDSFNGYTFFKNNKANYGRTHLSVPSYLSGKIYDEDNLSKFTEFIEDGWKNGYPKELSKNLISQSFFTYLRGPFKSNICNLDINIYCESFADKYSFIPAINDKFLPLDISFFNILPASLRYSAWRLIGYKSRPKEITEIPIMISKIFFQITNNKRNINNNEKWDSKRHIQSYEYNGFLDFLNWDKKFGKQFNYKYIHLLLPHGPYTRDKFCKLKTLENNAEGSIEHHLCAIYIMHQLNQHLKQLGIYKNSTIIINSDHGTVISDFVDLFPKINLDYKKETKLNSSLLNKRIIHKNDGDVSKQPASQVELRAAALLLIKPKGSINLPLKISKFNTQLIDINPTIKSIFNIQNLNNDGLDLIEIINTNAMYPRKQIHHATNSNDPEKVTKLQEFYRESSGWKIDRDAVYKK